MFLLDPGTGICQSNNVWNGIVPLKSKRDDVEKILGKPDTSGVNPFAAGYKTTDGEVTVIYSTGLAMSIPNMAGIFPNLPS